MLILGKEATDISSEAFREYSFPSGKYRIDRPLWLLVTDSGSHRVFDDSGLSHYVAAGFLAIAWESRNGQPEFVA